PETNRGLAPVVKPFDEWFVGAGARVLYELLWGAAGFVLVVICANVANVLIAHAAGRSRETAIRLALGASRGQIMRQFVVEGLVLSILGGAIGWWLADAAIGLYARFRTDNGVLLDITMGREVVMYLVAIAAGSALGASAGTAAHLVRLHVNDALT